MIAEEGKQAAIRGYAAFSEGDATGAMAEMSDSIEWVVGGDNAVTGTYTGKDAVLGFWMQLMEKGFRTEPREFLGDSDKVVVLTTVSAGDERRDTVDVLTYNDDGMLMRFETFGGEDMLNKIFAKNNSLAG